MCRSEHSDKPNAVCVPTPDGSGTSMAAVISDARQPRLTASANIRPGNRTRTRGAMGEKIIGTVWADIR